MAGQQFVPSFGLRVCVVLDLQPAISTRLLYNHEGTYLVDNVNGFAEAYQTMLLLAATKPGPYFIFDTSEQACVGAIDTTAQAIA